MAPVKNVYKLDHGVNLHSIELPKFKTNVLGFYIRRPLSIEEASKNALITRLLKRASSKYPTTMNLHVELDNLYGSVLMSDVSKMGDTQVVEFAVQFPNKKHIPEKDILLKELQLLKELIFEPLYDGDGFNKVLFEEEKFLLEQEINSRVNDKMQYSMERCIETMCKDESYKIHKYGDVDQLNKITPSSLKSHFEEILKTSLIDIIVVGDINSEDVRAKVEDTFSFERTDIIKINRETYKYPVEDVTYKVEEFDVQQGKLNLGFRTQIGYNDPLYHASLMFSYVFGGGANSKLFRNVREKESLCYYVFSRIEKFKSLMLVGSGIEVENYDLTLKLILKEFDNVKNGDFTEEELNLAKLTVGRSLRSMNDSQHSYMGFYFSQLVSSQNFDLDELINSINAVTREEVIEAGKYIQLDTVHFLTAKKEIAS